MANLVDTCNLPATLRTPWNRTLGINSIQSHAARILRYDKVYLEAHASDALDSHWTTSLISLMDLFRVHLLSLARHEVPRDEATAKSDS
jgi:hypothetical protein